MTIFELVLFILSNDIPNLMLFNFTILGYDSGEKKRIPAWCDRVIYRDNRSGPASECSLECPIVSSVLL